MGNFFEFLHAIQPLISGIALILVAVRLFSTERALAALINKCNRQEAMLYLSSGDLVVMKQILDTGLMAADAMIKLNREQKNGI